MAEPIVIRDHFAFVSTILPKISIQVSDLPKTFAIDYIVDDEDRHKVRYQNKWINHWNRPKAQRDIDMIRSRTDAE